MILVAVEEKPLVWSFWSFRISGTSEGMFYGELGVFRLVDWADVMSSRSPAKPLVPGLASSLPLATMLCGPLGYKNNPVSLFLLNLL